MLNDVMIVHNELQKMRKVVFIARFEVLSLTIMKNVCWDVDWAPLPTIQKHYCWSQLAPSYEASKLHCRLVHECAAEHNLQLQNADKCWHSVTTIY